MFKNPNYIYGPTQEVLVPSSLQYGEFMLKKMWQAKEKVALENAAIGQSTTYYDICQRGMNFAVFLRHLGLRKGQTVAICSENRLEFFDVVLGIACAGGVIATIGPEYVADQVRHVMSLLKPKFVVCSPHAYKQHGRLFKSLHAENVILLGNDKEEGALFYNDLTLPVKEDSKEVIADGKLMRNITYEEFEVVEVKGQLDTLFISYTSGTTGLPKAVMLSHLNVLTMCNMPTYHSEERLLFITPWIHVMGLIRALISLTLTDTSVFLPKFEVDLFLKTIEKYEINGITNEKLKHGEIAQQAMNLAVSLHRLGVRKGDVIGIVSENRLEYISSLIGGACLGATLTLINPLYSKDEITHAANISKPNYFICSKLAYDAHNKTIKSLDGIKKIILYGNDIIDGCISYNDLVTPTDENDTKESSNKIERLKSDIKYDNFIVEDVVGQTDTLLILYSSGTTGKSKGVMLTHFNVISMCSYEIIEYIDGAVLGAGPWFHVMGLIGQLYFFTIGKEVVFLSKFEINLYLNAIQIYKVALIFAAPAILVAVVKCEKQYNLSSVKRIVSGSAPLHLGIINDVKTKLPNLEGVIMGYGLTETTLAITIGRYSIPKSVNTACAGKVMPNTIVKVVGPNGQALGPYERGEVCAKGDLLMKGYLGGNTAGNFDDEGFFRTGDIGFYDEDGLLFVVDRLKELIKYKGNQVPPAEIEALLLQHDAVKDVGVVGLPDVEAGELPMAFVALKPGMSVTEKEIQDYVAERISKIKHLRGGVRFLSEIPKNGAGKILRQELKRLAIGDKNK